MTPLKTVLIMIARKVAKVAPSSSRSPWREHHIACIVERAISRQSSWEASYNSSWYLCSWSTSPRAFRMLAHAFLGVSRRSRLKAVSSRPSSKLSPSTLHRARWSCHAVAATGRSQKDVLKGSRDGGVARRIRTRPIAAVNVRQIELVSFDPNQCLHHRSRVPRDPSDVPPLEQRHRVVNGGP